MYVKKGDTVVVITGEEKGKQGKILKAYPKEGGAIVEGVNFVKRHTKPGRRQNQPGGIIEKEAPICISNLMLVCVKCNQKTKVGKSFLEDGTKVRICRKCGEMIDAL